jgi:hypothetical protein
MATPAGASVTKLTEHNYVKWAPEIRNLLGLQGVWRFVAAYNGWLPRPPLTPATQYRGQPTLPRTSEWFHLEPHSGDRSASHSYQSYRPGERLIKTASNEYVNVAGNGNCGSNHLMSLGQAMRKGIQFDPSVERGYAQLSRKASGLLLR